MENNNEMKINKLPAKTWYWLRMNDTALNWNPDMAGCSVKIDGGKEADKQASDFDGIETGAGCGRPLRTAGSRKCTRCGRDQ